jgi:hypothetical protein
MAMGTYRPYRAGDWVPKVASTLLPSESVYLTDTYLADGEPVDAMLAYYDTRSQQNDTDDDGTIPEDRY